MNSPAVGNDGAIVLRWCCNWTGDRFVSFNSKHYWYRQNWWYSCYLCKPDNCHSVWFTQQRCSCPAMSKANDKGARIAVKRHCRIQNDVLPVNTGNCNGILNFVIKVKEDAPEGKKRYLEKILISFPIFSIGKNRVAVIITAGKKKLWIIRTLF